MLYLLQIIICECSKIVEQMLGDCKRWQVELKFRIVGIASRVFDYYSIARDWLVIFCEYEPLSECGERLPNDNQKREINSSH